MTELALISLACSDGYKCGQLGGYMEQNPYSLRSEAALFDAWNEGWHCGLEVMPREIREAKVQSNLPALLNQQWKVICARP